MVQRLQRIGQLVLAPLVGLAIGACASEEIDHDRLLAAIEASDGVVDDAQHLGPPVARGHAGPARFVKPLLAAYDVERTRSSIEFVDGFYRAPGNEGYEATLDHVRDALLEAGFGGDDERFQLTILEGTIEAPSWARGETVEAPAWTPRSAQVVMVGSDGERTRLHGFDSPGDVDRTVLPVNAPSCDIEGPVAFHLEDLVEGAVLVTEAPLSRSLVRRAQGSGAVAVLSASCEAFNEDPTGAQQHLDLVQYRNLYYPPQLPLGQISPRSHQSILARSGQDPGLRIEFDAVVEFEERPLRTLVATIVGDQRPDECVAVSSHVNEPGAGDNASGVVGMLEAARSTAEAIRARALPRPARSIVFVWGDEFRMTENWLEAGLRETVVGISADMLSQSKAKTGAIALVERMPDPGAVRPIEPDRHTPWGANPVAYEELEPSGLAVVARCAMIDVGLAAGGWETADHPWEGGSDHDVYIEAGIPAVLIWHFTDFTYHSSLDRLDRVDLDELERSCVAVLAICFAVADPEPADLERYLATNDAERKLRVDAALGEEDEELAESWRDWTTGARHWLRALCLGEGAGR